MSQLSHSPSHLLLPLWTSISAEITLVQVTNDPTLPNPMPSLAFLDLSEASTVVDLSLLEPHSPAC